MRPRPKDTTKLPKQLLDELGENEGQKKYPSVRKSRIAERKERRKVERGQKRGRRQRQSATSQVDESHEFEGAKGPRLEIGRPLIIQANQLKSILGAAGQVRNHTPRECDNRTPTRIPRGLRDKLVEDDAEIAALERKLGIKGGKLPKAFVQDGLDTLLDGLGKDDGETATVGGKRKRSGEDDWLESKRENARAVEGLNNAGVREECSSPLEEGDGEGEVKIESLQGVSGSTGHFGDPESYSSDPPRRLPQKNRENPYVAPAALPKVMSGVKFVPPPLRKPSTSETEALIRLRRQMQRLLNRLSEANLLSILGEVECLYRDNPRQHVTSTLVELLFRITCDRASLADTFLVLHAGFIAGLYRTVGMDFGASVVQRIVEEFDHYYGQRDGGSITTEASNCGKITTNLIALLAELYNFQVIGSNLIFDYLILNVVSGQQLRHDDPSALKDIILMLQPAIATVGEANLSVRTKFMIDTISDLKNNRLKTGITASAVKSQHTVQIRKLLGSLNTGTIRASEPLRLSLKDIREADEKGKWWLVGASWKKDNEDPHGLVPLKQSHSPGCTAGAEVDGEDAMDIAQLAREQRMNTDIRRAIFITIMCASDYLDAHGRLVKLRLKRAQELEIPRVLIHCSGAEKVYNPYYTLMAKRLCGEHRLKMAFQFSLWDLFKRMGEGGDQHRGDAGSETDEDQELGTRKLVNLAKMFGNLIVEGSLGLGILKTLNLAYLQAKTRIFVELMLITIFLQSQRNSEGGRDERTIVDVFTQVRGVPQMAKGLMYFLRKVVSKTDVAGGKIEKDTVRWGCRVAGEALREIEMHRVAEG